MRRERDQLKTDVERLRALSSESDRLRSEVEELRETVLEVEDLVTKREDEVCACTCVWGGVHACICLDVRMHV